MYHSGEKKLSLTHNARDRFPKTDAIPCKWKPWLQTCFTLMCNRLYLKKCLSRVGGGRLPTASVFLCLGDKLQSCVLIPTTLTSLTVPALKHIAGNFALTFRPSLEKVHSPSSIVLSVLLSSSFILSKSYHRTKDSWTRGLCFAESRNTLRPLNF